MKQARGSGGGALAGLVVVALGALGIATDALAAPLGAQDGAGPVAQKTCGGMGLPPCPMQAWMRARVAAPLASNNLPALSSALQGLGSMKPDGAWASWSTFAEAGAAAAKRNDVAGARAACKGCHDAWREAYRAKYRMRPVPR